MFMRLESLPLTPSGKVDRKALALSRTPSDPANGPRLGPRDTVEAQLKRIWEEILGVHPIGVRDGFFELGGHSLLAIRLIAEVKERFSRELSLHELYQNPSVEALATLIRSGGKTVQASPLVLLHAGGQAKPIYFVHPSGGSIHWYTELARIMGSNPASKRPFYGVQAYGVDDLRNLHTRIEDMASCYVEAILGNQPEGPYHLGSWSMGVVIAFEMAQQLAARGQEVGLLALVDQGPDLPAREPEDHAAFLFDTFGKHLPLTLEQLRTLEPDGQVSHVWMEARKADWLYPQVSLEHFSRFVLILRTHTEAWRRYSPRSYRGSIHFFRAAEQPEKIVKEPCMGWERIAVGGVELHRVPGDHLSVMQEPHVRSLADKLTRCLNRWD
jgi:thioesterase domain-containing protein/acyl carrier protein